jgi:hypothetical protein
VDHDISTQTLNLWAVLAKSINLSAGMISISGLKSWREGERAFDMGYQQHSVARLNHHGSCLPMTGGGGSMQKKDGIIQD